eukprot:Sspe_Gene.7845::Locus_2660_Transcript_1_1_Confidence_1.000_Length_3518::g.7845::m.7845/K04990/PKD2L1; polycystin 2L1
MATGFLTREDIKELRRIYKDHRKDAKMGIERMEEEDDDLYKEEEGYKVPVETFMNWLDPIKKPEEGEVDQEVEKKLKAIQEELRKAGDEVDVEDFIRYYEADADVRFDIMFCQYQSQMARDSLALFIYIPFVFLFAYFLVQGRGLGTGYWMNNNIVDYFLEQEFDVSDELRFVKTYWDIGSDGEFWEFVDGPLVNGLWQADDGADESQVFANQLIRGSIMPIGALKMRQIRVGGEECNKLQTHMFENHVDDIIRAYGIDYLRDRLRDFRPRCYPEIATFGDSSYRGKYSVFTTIHDGLQIYSMNSTANVAAQEGKASEGHRLPPMFIETVELEDEMVAEEDRFVLEAFKHRSCGALNGSTDAWVRGKARNYHCDGYSLVIPYSWSLEKVKKAMGLLKDGISVQYMDPFEHKNKTSKLKWIDHQTRSISFEMFFYSKDIDLLSFSQFLVEVTASGAWVPIQQMNAFTLFNFDAHTDAYFVFLFIFLLYIVGFCVMWFVNVVSRTIQLRPKQKGSFQWAKALFKALWQFWVIFDMVNLTLFITTWVFRFYSWDKGLTSATILQTDYYPNSYETSAMATQVASLVAAGNGLLTFCRIFYFLQLHPQLNLLTKTLEKAASDLVGIVMIFIVVFIAFSLMSHVVYGLVIEDFRTFGQTVITLCRILIGDFDYEQLLTEQRIFTPVMFSLYNALAVFLLLNMVIAILDEAFSKVQDEKYMPGKLLQLMNNTDEPEFDTSQKNKRKVVMNLVYNNPILKELTWQIKRAFSEFQVLTGQYDRSDKEWIKKRRAIDRANPRIYWRNRLELMRLKKKTLPFRDKCHLIPRQLDNILMDQFGNDFTLLVNTLVWEPARAMRRHPSRLLEEVLQFHHYWQIEVEAVTQTGKTVKDLKERQAKELEEKQRQQFRKEQEKHKEEQKEDTKRRLRLKYGRDPTPEELMKEMSSVPPDDSQDIEKWWLFQVRRLHQITETLTKLAETRDRNFSSGGPKLRFTEWMIQKVSTAAQRELTESMGRIVQEEIQQEMVYGDPADTDKENMPKVLKKWRDGFYDELKRRGKLQRFVHQDEDVPSAPTERNIGGGPGGASAHSFSHLPRGRSGKDLQD